MNDVKKRYGFYPQDKWNSNMNLKQYFEGKNGVKELDNEHHYRLEKFKEAGLK